MNKHSDQFEASACDTPQTKRGHERRIALLLSANQLFLERGYDAVSLDDIVHHAGGSKASIYKYFGSKDGLFTAICDYRCEIFFKDICNQFDCQQDQLRHYLIQTLKNFYQHIIQPENAAFLRLIVEQAQRSPELARYIMEQGPRHIQKAIENALTRAHQNKLIHCTQPEYSAQLYFGIIRDLEWHIIMNTPIEKTEQEISNYIQYCVDRFLDAHQKH
ncbi:TetR/AcrR family transcriptional regulator [Acinetobacter sp. TY1]|uniref:TetR/AcrR family transcriptional regulator n=1 Tax=Acinetobacter sp. TY1 TaxID=3387626 RepID=UPI003AF56305